MSRYRSYSKHMKRVMLLLLFVFLGFGLVAGYLRYGKKERFNCGNYGQDKKRVDVLFSKYPGAIAYQRFKEQMDPSCAYVHDLAHAAGTRLYEKEGLAGITACDASFVYGCYHGFLTAAFQKEGIAMFPAVERACTGNGTDKVGAAGCLHGVGHGVLAVYPSYNEENLQKALETCDTFSSSDARKACYNGVFMEYNEQPMQKQGGALRVFDASWPLAPCMNIASLYQKDCYYEQPSWWTKVGVSVGKMGAYCLLVTDFNSKTACAKGIGRALVASLPGEVGESCSLLGALGISDECIAGAVEQLISEKNSNPLPLCDFLATTEKAACIKHIQSTRCEVFSQCD